LSLAVGVEAAAVAAVAAAAGCVGGERAPAAFAACRAGWPLAEGARAGESTPDGAFAERLLERVLAHVLGDRFAASHHRNVTELSVMPR
jgi:hypothetical protein